MEGSASLPECSIGIEGHVRALIPAQRVLLARTDGARRLVWKTHAIGTSQCVSCSAVMLTRLASSVEAMLELARLSHEATRMQRVTGPDDAYRLLDEQAVRRRVEDADTAQRRGMAAEALSHLHHALPEVLRKAKQWKQEADTPGGGTTGASSTMVTPEG